jgi:hypothetical protein
MGSLSGLNYLINLHRLTGISYFGANFDSNRKYTLRVIINLWSLTYFIITTSVLISDPILQSIVFNSKLSSTKFIIYNIISKFTGISFFILPFAINLSLSLKGSKILKLLTRISNRFDSKYNNNKIGKYITLIDIVINLLSSIVVYVAVISMRGVSVVITPFNFIHIVVLMFQTFNKHSFITLIIFKNIIITNYLRQVKQNTTLSKFPFIYKTIRDINSSVKEFDQLISLTSFMVIITNTLITFSSLCLLALNFKECYYYIIPTIIDSYVILIIICFVSEIIPKNISKLCDHLENLTSNSLTTNQISLQYLQLIKSHENNICFTAMGLFNIRLNTILTITSIIITNAVVLIQTSGL